MSLDPSADRFAEELIARLETARPALAALPDDRLIAAWSETVEAFLDPRSSERRALDPHLLPASRLSREGLAAALQAVLGGVRREPFRALLAAARNRRTDLPGFVLAILAGNLPGLAVQPLSAAVALRRPALLKSSSAEPWFAPAFVAALVRREPAFSAYAAATWSGGDRRIEDPILARAIRVLAYGDRGTLDDLSARVPDRLFGYGPKTSLGIVGAMGLGDLPALAAGLARDVALFDQRGCLSIGSVYTSLPLDGAIELARAISSELDRLAALWPPGAADPRTLAAVQQLRLAADLRGVRRFGAAIRGGTVLLEPDPRFVPSPGERTLLVQPLDDLTRIPRLLEPWTGRIQGVALVGADAEALRPALAALGVSRFAPPGELQRPDASWHNGGVHPLDALLGDAREGAAAG